jgi:hypothetical protein
MAPEQFFYWFAKACQRVRKAAKVRIGTIAYKTGFTPDTIGRFERIEHRPMDPDGFAATYAAEAGLDDGRAIYDLALALWWEHGDKPVIQREDETPKQPNQAVLEMVKLGTIRTRARGERGAKSKTTPKKRATGR